MDENPYDYFVGKPVTVVTVGSSLRFSPENHLNYFIGILRSVDEWTCTLLHPVTGGRSIFRLEHVVAMHEEQQMNPEDPEDLKYLQNQDVKREEFKKNNPNLFARPTAPPTSAREPQTPPPMSSPMPSVKIKSQDTQFVDLDQLQDLAKLSRSKKK